MYNRYLQQLPEERPPAPAPCPETPPPPRETPEHTTGLLSLLSDALGQKSGRNDLLSKENLIVLAALAFLTFNGEELDTELIILAVIFLLLGL